MGDIFFNTGNTQASLGFMYLAEQTSPEDNKVTDLKVITENGIRYSRFHTGLHSFRCYNRNKRRYWGPNVEQCVHTERIQDMLRRRGWFGEMDHPLQIEANNPLSEERVRTIYMPSRSHKILNPIFKGDMMEADIETASGSENGIGFHNEIIQGLIPAFSCRSIAFIGTINGEPYVIIRFLVTYDWVLYPSHREAEMIGGANTITKQDKIIVESAHPGLVLPGGRRKFTEDVMIPLDELIGFTADRDENIKILMESFELTREDIVGFDSTLEHAIVRDGNNVIFANISAKTTNEVKDFLSSF